MSSINQQQPEQNHQNLAGPDAVAKIRELAEGAGTCFFCTAITSGAPIPTRPMTVQQVDDDGSLWFLSAIDSQQNAHLAQDDLVQLMFQGSSHSDFLTLYGRARVTTDRAKIDQLWKPMFKTWFTEGSGDPRITVIEVRPTEGYYWDTKHNRVIVFAKIVAGAITGKTFDDSIEGRLRV